MAKNLKLNIKNSQLAEALKLNKVKKAPASDESSKKASAKDKSSPIEELAPETLQKPKEDTRAAFQETSQDSSQGSAQDSPWASAPAVKEGKSFREEAKEFESKRDSSEMKKSNNYPFDRPFVVREPRQAPAAFRQPKESSETVAPDAAKPFTKERSFDRPSYPPRERSHDERGERNSGSDRPYQPRHASGDRPAYQGRSGNDRPYQPRQPSGDRPPYQGRPGNDRPYQPRQPSGDRPPYQGRPGNDRPYQPRQPSGDRPPYQGRPGNDRPYQPRQPSGDRPQGERFSGPRSSGPYSGPRNAGGPSTGRPPMQPRTDNPLSRQKMEFQSHRAFSDLGIVDENKTKVREDKKPTAFKEFRDVKNTRKVETQKSFDARDRHGLRDTNEDIWRKKRPSYKGKEGLRQEDIIRPKQLKVRLPITVKDLAAEMKLKASQLIAKLFMQGVVITLNDYLDDETTVQLLGHEFECDIQIDSSQEKRVQVSDKTAKQEIQETDVEKLILRSPIITFMGHVDHGKTSLIDYIRKSDVAAKEAGAITQHIGAFKVHTKIGDVTIIDTPGHEAFSAMRSRGAVVTDIVVLVVAGDEGIKAQTEEAIRQAQEANVKIVVAINKSDRPNFNEETVIRQLSEHNLLAESWGGDVITVKCSAVTGEGINELLEMLSLQSEVLELRANPNTRARGTILESEMHKGLGCVATLLVQNGTLRLGDAIVFDQEYGKVKTMQDEYGKNLKDAGPSTPVKITGLSGLPSAGSDFIVVKDEKEARIIAEARQEGERRLLLKQPKTLGLDAFLAKNQETQGKKTLNLIIRADVQGSVEALKTSLMKIKSTKVDLNIISAEVGEVSESDIQLAQASKATILGFHTQIESHAEILIKQTKVHIKLHDIIYHAVDEIKKCMLQLLDKVAEEKDTGSAEVLAVFKSSQLGLICGCIVQEGTIHRNHQVRQMRDKKVVWKGSIASIKRVKDDVREVNKGLECGILLQNNNDIKVGDILQAYETIYLDQEL